MKIPFLILIVLVTSPAIAQVPNSSFENWHWVGGWYLDPDGWQTNNAQIIQYVMQDTDAHSGDYACQLASAELYTGSISTGFPIAAAPYQIHLWVKASDTTYSFHVTVKTFTGGELADTVRQSFSGLNPVYTELIIPFTATLNPDSMTITIATDGSFGFFTVLVDDVSVDITTSVPEETGSEFFLLPNNLIDDQLPIEWNTNGDATLSIIDAAGKVLLRQTLPAAEYGKLNINTSGFPEGFYSALFKYGNKREVKKFARF